MKEIEGIYTLNFESGKVLFLDAEKFK